MQFKYSAKTRDSLLTKKGEIDAPDQVSALTQLQQNGMIVYSLLPISNSSNPLNLLKEVFGISFNDKVRFTESLGNMLTAGLALTKSLEILIAQAGKMKMSDTIQQILNDIEAGSQLSAAMEKQPEIFPESYTSLVKAGEASGKLSEVLMRLASSMDKQRQFRSKVKGAMIYPAVITLVMMGVFVLLMVFVIPQLTESFKSNATALPLPTVIMIAISDFMVVYWYIIIIGFIGMLIGLRYFYTTTMGRYAIDNVMLRTPIMGSIIKQSTIVEFTRTLSLLTDSGVPIVEGLNIVKTTISNIIYRDSVDRFIDDVKHGYPLSQSITKEKIYPAFVGQMVVVGEETGTMSQRLDSIAKYYEDEVDKIVKNISVLIEPIIMLILGTMVCLLIIAVIVPIYQLTSNLH